MRLSRRFRSILLLLVALSQGEEVVPDATTPAPTGSPTITPWQGCIDLNNPNARVTIGEKTTICLIISNGVDWGTDSRTYMRLNFQPDADEYSRFHVPRSYEQLVEDQGNVVARELYGNADGNTTIAVHVSSQQA